MQKRKDKAFISRMVKTLTKLETKQLTPRHNRKRRLFTSKQKSSPLIPKELASNYHVLLAPEPVVFTVPEPLPHIRWNDVRIEPALPNQSCSVHSCSSTLTPANFPFLLNFPDHHHSQAIHHDAVELSQTAYHEVVQPSPKPFQAAYCISVQRRLPCFPRMDCKTLHGYRGLGRRLQGGLRGRRDRQGRDAPDS